MYDNLPAVIAVPLFVILAFTVAYEYWIRPGYEKDMAARHARDTR